MTPAPNLRPALSPSAGAIDALIAKVRFNADGLVAAIAQDVENGDVLMMAWMNADTLRETLTSGRACYWSRSRGVFWRKGDTSGHTQTVHDVMLDCDGDAVLLKVTQVGAACHTGARTCFFTSVNEL